jgi:hypothetical protein
VSPCVSALSGICKEEKAIAATKTIVSVVIIAIHFFILLLFIFFASLMVVSLFLLSFHLNVFIWVTVIT